MKIKNEHYLKIGAVIVIVFVSGILTNYALFEYGVFSVNKTTCNGIQVPAINGTGCITPQNNTISIPCTIPRLNNSAILTHYPSGCVFNNGNVDPKIPRSVSSVVNNIDQYYGKIITVTGNFSMSGPPRPAIACILPPNPLPPASYDDSGYMVPYKANYIVDFSSLNGVNIPLQYLQIRADDNHGVPNPDLVLPLKQGQQLTLTGKLVKIYTNGVCDYWKYYKSAYLEIQASQVGIFWAQPASLIPFSSLINHN